jgi:hypothetical protein
VVNADAPVDAVIADCSDVGVIPTWVLNRLRGKGFGAIRSG